jgi:hypothetical protein
MIEAKPISINGIDFKSRLEARWYTFFRHFGVCLYEPKQYVIDEPWYDADNDIQYRQLKYTPDFYIPQHDWLVEIKPQRRLTKTEAEKYWRFSLEHPLILIAHSCEPPTDSKTPHGILLPEKAVFWLGTNWRGQLKLLHLEWYTTQKSIFKNTRNRVLMKAYQNVVDKFNER